nr:hypothetical protein L204_05911 [Cryptococcus depauperatus CBS 7855]
MTSMASTPTPKTTTSNDFNKSNPVMSSGRLTPMYRTVTSSYHTQSPTSTKKAISAPLVTRFPSPPSTQQKEKKDDKGDNRKQNSYRKEMRVFAKMNKVLGV